MKRAFNWQSYIWKNINHRDLLSLSFAPVMQFKLLYHRPSCLNNDCTHLILIDLDVWSLYVWNVEANVNFSVLFLLPKNTILNKYMYECMCCCKVLNKQIKTNKYNMNDISLWTKEKWKVIFCRPFQCSLNDKWLYIIERIFLMFSLQVQENHS